MAMTIALGFVKDEKAFLQLDLSKASCKTSLNTTFFYLPFYAQILKQKFYSPKNFPTITLLRFGRSTSINIA